MAHELLPPRGRRSNRTNTLKLIAQLGGGILSLIIAIFGGKVYLDGQHVSTIAYKSDNIVREQKLEIVKSDANRKMTLLAFNASQAFIDTQYMVNRRELRWMDQMPQEKMSNGDKRHYRYLQEAQTDLEKRKLLMRTEELKIKPIKKIN